MPVGDTTAPRQSGPNEDEAGNVLFIILLAVVLFAALSYAVTTSTRSGSGDTSSEQNNLIASQLVQYGTALESAIMRLRLNGCSDSEISFENPVVAGYTNAGAPSSKKCHVFDPAGGGMVWQNPPTGTNTLTTTYLLNTSLTDRWPYIFSGDHCGLYIGTDATPANCATGNTNSMELIVYVPVKTQALCETIQSKFGGVVPPPTGSGYTAGSAATPIYAKFTGTYRNFYDHIPTNQRTGCLRNYTSANDFPFYTNNPFFFYHVLIAR